MLALRHLASTSDVDPLLYEATSISQVNDNINESKSNVGKYLTETKAGEGQAQEQMSAANCPALSTLVICNLQ